jgi:hypothetical protein
MSMTHDGGDFWDLVYRGCGIPGDAPPPAKEGCPPLDREAEQQRVFRFYERALRRNRPGNADAELLNDRGEGTPPAFRDANRR